MISELVTLPQVRNRGGFCGDCGLFLGRIELALQGFVGLVLGSKCVGYHADFVDIFRELGYRRWLVCYESLYLKPLVVRHVIGFFSYFE